VAMPQLRQPTSGDISDSCIGPQLVVASSQEGAVFPMYKVSM
jgi:hypothetical protein